MEPLDAPAGAPAHGRRATDGHAGMTKPRPLLPYAEAALIGVSLSAVAGFWRLFNSGAFFWRLTAMAVASHVAAMVARRLGWSLAGAAALSGVALVLTVS